MNLSPELTYQQAEIQDCQLLTETATRSKQDWGYSDNVMELWKDDLLIDEDYIRKNTVIKVYVTGRFIGFFAVIALDNEILEIDHLWLLPGEKRKGFGSLIFKTILQYGKTNAFKKAILIAEPNAKGFYEKMGGTVQGTFQSKIKDRQLEIYHYTL
ncbi:MAG: hydrolase [Fluviicola sp.]|jgi:GNAT superfamily N-acetyltransferase|uniref:GNAT family N-acetyltransferase n=1 Tax=Fluviicola sp. TaxID=1917219 RepID=UPI00260707EA|nr:GNAT family N-acetyltransferase [Fluviicola sp.]MDF3025946.1 hydrolase [Fluviicola sp.]